MGLGLWSGRGTYADVALVNTGNSWGRGRLGSARLAGRGSTNSRTGSSPVAATRIVFGVLDGGSREVREIPEVRAAGARWWSNSNPGLGLPRRSRMASRGCEDGGRNARRILVHVREFGRLNSPN